MAISMLKIRRPLGRLIFNMGIAIPGKTVFLIETAPCSLKTKTWSQKLRDWQLKIDMCEKQIQCCHSASGNWNRSFKDLKKSKNFLMRKILLMKTSCRDVWTAVKRFRTAQPQRKVYTRGRAAQSSAPHPTPTPLTLQNRIPFAAVRRKKGKY